MLKTSLVQKIDSLLSVQVSNTINTNTSTKKKRGLDFIKLLLGFAPPHSPLSINSQQTTGSNSQPIYSIITLLKHTSEMQTTAFGLMPISGTHSCSRHPLHILCYLPPCKHTDHSTCFSTNPSTMGSMHFVRLERNINPNPS